MTGKKKAAPRPAVPLDREGRITVVEADIELKVHDLAQELACTRSTVINGLLRYALRADGIAYLRRML